MDSTGQAEAPRLFDRRKLRQATLILPTTGERVKRDVTLRDPKLFGNASGGVSNERAPLLPKTNPPPPDSRLQRIKAWTKDSAVQAYEFSKTPTAKGIFKCSIAYLIATLATFSLPFASFLGTHQDGNQLAANIVVWFDPARSAGSMDLGIVFAFLAFLYGSAVAFSSQGVSAFFAAQDLLVVGHVVVLLVFCWGGLGFLAWFKQYMGHPLVNTASSLASLAIVTCLTKEGVVQTGEFSYYRIMQVLKMLIVGIVISFGINLTIWPTSARKVLRENLMKTTDAFADLLTAIASSFLTGSDEYLNHPNIVAASDNFKSVFGSLPTQLAEARYEHHPLGTESQYHIEKRLVECVQRLAQDIGGLRSAAATQFALLSQGKSDQSMRQPASSGDSAVAFADTRKDASPDSKDAMTAQASALRGTPLDQSSISSGESPRGSASGTQADSTIYVRPVQTPAQIFETFIEHLGPPMKSLAYTLREILRALPYGSDAKRENGNLPRFRTSLTEAIKLFNTSRREALGLVYRSKELSEASSMHVAANFEEVAASCGHFSSSLEDFADGCLVYLNILDELELEMTERPNGRTWDWLKFWRYRWRFVKEHEESDLAHAETASIVDVASSKLLKAAPGITEAKLKVNLPLPYRLYPHFRWFRREDVKFAIKVGGGAAFYAMFSFIPETKPYYDHWHLEWGLVSYMLVCSMNIGASNTTGWSRSYGTLIGALAGIVVWMICRENPYALAFCGWIVSLICFYFIIARSQGPMGRFILLTYNLSVLYTFGLTINDPDADGNETDDGVSLEIFEVALHRFVAVLLGVIGGLIVTHYIWPISAREKVKGGLSLLWLRMGLIWKRGPLSLLDQETTRLPSYMDIRTETKLREYVDTLDSLRKSAESEFKLRGPFPTESFDTLIQSTSRMLDAFHALNVLISKDVKATEGEMEILSATREEREQVSIRICHMLSVLAASLNMEYPLNDTLPRMTHVRERLLAKIFDFRQSSDKKTVPADEDYEVLYCYALVTGQIAKEVEISGKELEKLYESIGEKVLKLQ